MTQEKFEGFNFEPNTWNFPMCINGWVNKLTGNEFKVLWYILRHTYGWHKDKDKIAFKQFRFGIKKKDGNWLDKGTGLGIASLKSAIKGLIDKNFIETNQERNEKGKFSIVEYKPKYKNPPTGSPTADKCPLQVVSSSKTITNYKQTIVGKADKVKEYNFTTKLNELLISNRKDLQIIGLYWKYKGFRFENEKQWQSALKRELRPAKNLVGYSNKEIENVLEWLCDNADFKFTLESVFKYIDENLDELPIKKDKKIWKT